MELRKNEEEKKGEDGGEGTEAAEGGASVIQ